MPSEKVPVKCNECGKLFKLGPRQLLDPECPKCGGVDVDLRSGGGL